MSSSSSSSSSSSLPFVVVVVVAAAATLIVAHADDVVYAIDTDAGADDAVAIGMMLSSSARFGHTVAAITCTYGNTDLPYVVRNVLETVDVFADRLRAQNRLVPKVYAGAAGPLLNGPAIRSPYIDSVRYYGHDGFGDNAADRPTAAAAETNRSAVEALLALSRTHAGRLRVLVLGPTTNLATALIVDPEFGRRVDRVYIMGGSVSGTGNTAPGVEFNFGADPEGNRVVLDATWPAGRPPVLVPWDTNALTGVTMRWWQHSKQPPAVAGNAAGGGTDIDRVENFFTRIERVSSEKSTKFWQSADSLTAAVVLEPTVVTTAQSLRITAILCGSFRGGVTLDHTNVTALPANAHVVRAVDIALYKRTVEETLLEK